VDLKVKITITDELTDDIIMSSGSLDLASGEISRIEYVDYDLAERGAPFEQDDYEFTSGMLSHNGKDVEFRVDVNKVSGQYSVSANELLEIKVRAAQLFAGMSGRDMLSGAAGGVGGGSKGSDKAEPKPGMGRPGRLH
jgi:hypothetical protein